MDQYKTVWTYSLFNAVALDSSASIAKIIDISRMNDLTFSIWYTTTAGNVDVTYELSLDKVNWTAAIAETNLADLTVGSGILTNDFDHLAKYARFTATEDTAATVFSAILAIR
jgi:hypothetical protein